MENQNTQKEETIELLIEWSCNFTDAFINDHILPNAEELINDKAFVTLLKMWKNEKDLYNRFRSQDVKIAFEERFKLSKLCKNVKLESFHNSVFTYNNTLQSIVMNWGDAK